MGGFSEEQAALAQLLHNAMRDKPFSELFTVTLSQQGSQLVGEVLLQAVEQSGYSFDQIDAVGALTSAAMPLVMAMMNAASKRNIALDGFIMDFVYPSTKGVNIQGKRVLLVDSWLSEKSYVQTSSLVTLRHGNELSLDFGIVERLGAETIAVLALVSDVVAQEDGKRHLQIIHPVTGEHTTMPLICAYNEAFLRAVQ